jgi:hypothetical protein
MIGSNYMRDNSPITGASKGDVLIFKGSSILDDKIQTIGLFGEILWTYQVKGHSNGPGMYLEEASYAM